MNIVKKALRKLTKTRNTSDVREISYEKLKELIKSNSDINIVDVRSPQEYAENRIKFAINIPLYDLEKGIERVLPDKNRKIVLYCQSGARSKKAYNVLEKMGYVNIYSLKGGIEATN